MYRHTDKHILGVDIGGSHITAALVHGGRVAEQSLSRRKLDTKRSSAGSLLKDWIKTMQDAMSVLDGAALQGVGIAMPGPFDYVHGISRLEGLDKYESLYGINIKTVIINDLQLEEDIPVLFENDASCFGLGAGMMNENGAAENVLAITLGTGFGAAFIRQGGIVRGDGIPENGHLYNIPFKDGIAEDYISARWLISEYGKRAGTRSVRQVKELASLAIDGQDEQSKEVFGVYAANLATCLAHWLRSFKADRLVIGGSISRSACLFVPELKSILKKK
jgi:glucokinase